MMLRKKLRNNTILMRTALLEGLLMGRSVLYISIINNATMEENSVIYEVIMSLNTNRGCTVHTAPHQENQ